MATHDDASENDVGHALCSDTGNDDDSANVRDAVEDLHDPADGLREKRDDVAEHKDGLEDAGREDG
jgi:hypothetical protein